MPAPPVADATARDTAAVAPRAPATRHVPELDGLRALAIWAVLGAHLFFTWPATHESSAFLPVPLAAAIGHGWLGVDLFFVLSGYLITSILLRTKTGGRGAYFSRFYLHRVTRILPLYFAVLLVLFVCFHGRYGAFFALCALMAGNLATLFNIPIPDAAGPFWSLAVEEQFYLVWPWLVLALDARRLAWVAGAVLVIEPFVRIGAHGHDLELTWFRADGLAMGAFLAAWFATWTGDPRKARDLALVLLAVAAAVTLAGVSLGTMHESVVAGTSLRITQAIFVFGAALVAAVAYSGRPWLAFMRSPATTVTALLSYCLYLVHKPISDTFAWAYAKTPFAASLAPVPTLAVRVVCVLALAYGVAALSRRFLERPFIALGHRSELAGKLSEGRL